MNSENASQHKVLLNRVSITEVFADKNESTQQQVIFLQEEST